MDQRFETAHHYISTAQSLFDTINAVTSVAEAHRSRSSDNDPRRTSDDDDDDFGDGDRSGEDYGEGGRKRTGEARRAARVQKEMDNSLPAVLASAWAISKLDIQKTLRHVCDKVLEDTGVTLPERARRAAALRCCGAVFLAARGRGARSRGKVDAKRHIDRAMRVTQAAAQGLDVTDPNDDEDDEFTEDF